MSVSTLRKLAYLLLLTIIVVVAFGAFAGTP